MPVVKMQYRHKKQIICLKIGLRRKRLYIAPYMGWLWEYRGNRNKTAAMKTNVAVEGRLSTAGMDTKDKEIGLSYTQFHMLRIVWSLKLQILTVLINITTMHFIVLTAYATSNEMLAYFGVASFGQQDVWRKNLSPNCPAVTSPNVFWLKCPCCPYVFRPNVLSFKWLVTCVCIKFFIKYEWMRNLYRMLKRQLVSGLIYRA